MKVQGVDLCLGVLSNICDSSRKDPQIQDKTVGIETEMMVSDFLSLQIYFAHQRHMFSWWPQHILTDPAPMFGALEVPFSCVRVQSALAHLQHLSRCLLVSAGPMCGVPASQETWRTRFLQVPLRTLRTRTFHFQHMFYP